MKRVIFLATVALLLMLVLAPVALAQGTTMAGGTTASAPSGTTMAAGTTASAPSGTTGGPLPSSGGPQILLPAAALLLGSGILTYAILRRR
jgi:hypothetical protein